MNVSKGDRAFEDGSGNYRHGKGVYSRYGTRSEAAILKIHPDWRVVRDTDKFVYIFPLRRKWNTLARVNGWTELPFPKPSYAARLLDAPGSPGCELGANPRGRSTIEVVA